MSSLIRTGSSLRVYRWYRSMNWIDTNFVTCLAHVKRFGILRSNRANRISSINYYYYFLFFIILWSLELGLRRKTFGNTKTQRVIHCFFSCLDIFKTASPAARFICRVQTWSQLLFTQNQIKFISIKMVRITIFYYKKQWRQWRNKVIVRCVVVAILVEISAQGLRSHELKNDLIGSIEDSIQTDFYSKILMECGMQFISVLKHENFSF